MVVAKDRTEVRPVTFGPSGMSASEGGCFVRKHCPALWTAKSASTCVRSELVRGFKIIEHLEKKRGLLRRPFWVEVITQTARSSCECCENRVPHELQVASRK
jgi:hypothetical protein